MSSLLHCFQGVMLGPQTGAAAPQQCDTVPLRLPQQTSRGSRRAAANQDRHMAHAHTHTHCSVAVAVPQPNLWPLSFSRRRAVREIKGRRTKGRETTKKENRPHGHAAKDRGRGQRRARDGAHVAHCIAFALGPLPLFLGVVSVRSLRWTLFLVATRSFPCLRFPAPPDCRLSSTCVTWCFPRASLAAAVRR
jgi:hypothetical protein